MLWINKEAEAEQVQIESPDMTAAIIRLPECQVLVVSYRFTYPEKTPIHATTCVSVQKNFEYDAEVISVNSSRRTIWTFNQLKRFRVQELLLLTA